jgi:hypothetical protein
LKVLWSNKIGKSDLRWTYGTAGYGPGADCLLLCVDRWIAAV